MPYPWRYRARCAQRARFSRGLVEADTLYLRDEPVVPAAPVQGVDLTVVPNPPFLCTCSKNAAARATSMRANSSVVSCHLRVRLGVRRSERCVDRAGHYLAIRLQSQSLLVVRSDDGALGAFYNVCRHRGTELVPLAVVGGQFTRSIVCPYHGWATILTGACAAPCIWRLIRRGRTTRHRSGQWGGFIFVCLNPDEHRPSVQHWAGTRAVAPYPLADLRVDHSITYAVEANWRSSSRIITSATTAAPSATLSGLPAFKQGWQSTRLDDGVPHRESANTFTASGTTNRAAFVSMRPKTI